jgi:hypothetical protein
MASGAAPPSPPPFLLTCTTPEADTAVLTAAVRMSVTPATTDFGPGVIKLPEEENIVCLQVRTINERKVYAIESLAGLLTGGDATTAAADKSPRSVTCVDAAHPDAADTALRMFLAQSCRHNDGTYGTVYVGHIVESHPTKRPEAFVWKVLRPPPPILLLHLKLGCRILKRQGCSPWWRARSSAPDK